MEAFLATPLQQLPARDLALARFRQFSRLRVCEGFFAVTGWSGNRASYVAGLKVQGSRTELENLIETRRKQREKEWPAGRAGLVRSGPVVIETFAWNDQTTATAWSGKWCFLASNVANIEQTLAFFRDRHSPGTLHTEPTFQASLGQMPPGFDGVFFARTGAAAERVADMFAAVGQKTTMEQLRGLQQFKAVTAGIKIEGLDFRDVIFVAKAPGALPSQLSERSFALVTPDTVLHHAMSLPAPQPGAPPSAAASIPLPPGVGDLLPPWVQDFKADEWMESFGPELGTVVDWAADAPQPSMVFVCDVRDAAKAQSLIDRMVTSAPGQPAWVRQKHDGVTIHIAPQQGLGIPAPALAFNGTSFLLGLNFESVQSALQKGFGNGARASAEYRKTLRSVRKPTGGVLYIESRALFERLYGILRPLMIMGGGFEGGAYVDLTKLPTTGTVSRHLSPMIFSQSSETSGSRLESVGTVTLTQLIAAVAASVTVWPPEWLHGTGPFVPPASSPGGTPAVTSPSPPDAAEPEEP